MTEHAPNNASTNTPTATSWSAVFSVAVCVACLITVEFLPAGLLTPMASGLGISPGMAGQTLTATAVAAIFSSLFASVVTQGIDRRRVVMGYSAMLILSCLITALSTSFATMMIGRALLGLALGGFWAMAAAITMRLAHPGQVAMALSVVFGGVSVALVLAAPAGSFLGDWIGWRGVFLVAAGLGMLCLIWQALVLPAMPSTERRSPAATFLVLRRSGVPIAMLALFATFAAQFSFFSYLRPFFESVPQFGIDAISTTLLLFGLANFIGTSLSSRILRLGIGNVLGGTALLLALGAILLIAYGQLQALTVAVVSIWGFAFGLIPVGWSTWVTRSMPDDAESAGGLQVAVIQVANAFGAALGGYVLDASGPRAPVAVSAVLFGLSGLVVLLAFREQSLKRSRHAIESKRSDESGLSMNAAEHS